MMRPDELDEKLRAARLAGGHPFFVSCTVGTTVFGAFDPVDAIADVCEKHNVWLHVDVSPDNLLIVKFYGNTKNGSNYLDKDCAIG